MIVNYDVYSLSLYLNQTKQPNHNDLLLVPSTTCCESNRATDGSHLSALLRRPRARQAWPKIDEDFLEYVVPLLPQRPKKDLKKLFLYQPKKLTIYYYKQEINVSKGIQFNKENLLQSI